jgi:NADH:ubiquinone oxidoreductase subunit D
MRETEFYGRLQDLSNRFNSILQFIQNFTNSVRLDSTGKEIRLLALQKLLIEKGIITEAEMTTKSGEVITEMQKQAEEEAKKAAAPEITVPTTQQVQQVEATKGEATAPVIPPQA